MGISVDAPENARVTKDALKVPFPLLSDSDLKAHKAFRVLNRLDDATMAKYNEWHLDVEGWSERRHHTVAVPAMFLIDEHQIIRFAHADRDYKTRPDMDQLLRILWTPTSKQGL